MFIVAVADRRLFGIGRDTDTQLPPLRTAEVVRGDLEFTIDATGTVEPEEVVDVGAQVAGKIESLGTDPRHPERTIDYGSPVEVGTVLARIDDSLYHIGSRTGAGPSRIGASAHRVDRRSSRRSRSQRRAGEQRSAANAGQAVPGRARLEAGRGPVDNVARCDQRSGIRFGAIRPIKRPRRRSVSGNAAIAQAAAQVTFAKANVAKTRADLSQAQATLQRAQTNLGYCTIKSPVKGVIVDRRINVGQTVVSSLNSPSLFLIAKDLKRLEVWASVNEADIGNIRSGQTVRFTVDAYPGHVFHGVVAEDQPRLNATMNQNIVTYTVVVDTDNSDGKLLPYLTADVEFQVAEHQGRVDGAEHGPALAAVAPSGWPRRVSPIPTPLPTNDSEARETARGHACGCWRTIACGRSKCKSCSTTARAPKSPPPTCSRVPES